MRLPATRASLVLWILWILLVDQVAPGKILFFMPFLTPSMRITITPVAKELVSRGHDVTIVSSAKPSNLKGAREFYLDVGITELFSGHSEYHLHETKTPPNSLGIFFDIIQRVFNATDMAFGSPEISRAINEPYDIVVANPCFGNEVAYFLAYKHNASLVLYATVQQSFPWSSYALGEPSNAALQPFFILNLDRPLSLKERIINTLASNIFHYGIRNWYVFGRLETIIDQHYSEHKNRPRLVELERTASLGFSFGHPMLMDGFRPAAPNSIMLGLMNCQENPKLPPDLQKFMDGATEGVIYLSFGSLLRTSLMSDQRRQLFLSVLGKLKQKVLWKWEQDSEMPDKPANVITSKWFPQQAILSHPNLKLFITHGGQSSFQESLCFQKPVLVFPFYGDQPGNAREAVSIGFGRSLSYKTLTEDMLSEAVEDLLNNPKYAQVAREFGSTITDEMTKPLPRAIWWMEYLLRHPRAKHLRSPVHALEWYQLHLLDVYAVLTLVAVAWCYTVYAAMRCCCGKKKIEKKMKKN